MVSGLDPMRRAIAVAVRGARPQRKHQKRTLWQRAMRALQRAIAR
jgi:hypothetical protein